MKCLFKSCLAFLVLFINTLLYSQNISLSNIAFTPSEKVSYEVYYNIHFVWINVGVAKFYVNDTIIQNKKAYLFISEGSSHQNFDWFFKVRDSYKSIVDANNLQPLWFERNTNEGGYQVLEQYNVNTEKKKIYSYTLNSKQKPQRDTLSFNTMFFDPLSVSYFLRSIDLSKIKMNSTISLPVVTDNILFPSYVRCLGKEKITNKKGKTHHCIKLSMLTIKGSVFSGGETLLVWVTDDKYHIPVQFETPVRIGSVKAYLLD